MTMYPTDRSWIVDPFPVLEATPLRVDWPARGPDPFDLTDRRTQRMYFASGFTRAWPAADGLDGLDDRDVIDAVPRGYTVLSLIEKLAVVYQGNLIAEWPRSRLPADSTTPPPGGGEPRLVPMVQFQHLPSVWAARDPRWVDRARAGYLPPPVRNKAPLAVSGSGHSDYGDVVDLALALSAAIRNEPIMITDVVESVDWH